MGSLEEMPAMVSIAAAGCIRARTVAIAQTCALPVRAALVATLLADLAALAATAVTVGRLMAAARLEIGRASGRERVEMSGVAVALEEGGEGVAAAGGGWRAWGAAGTVAGRAVDERRR